MFQMKKHLLPLPLDVKNEFGYCLEITFNRSVQVNFQ